MQVHETGQSPLPLARLNRFVYEHARASSLQQSLFDISSPFLIASSSILMSDLQTHTQFANISKSNQLLRVAFLDCRPIRDKEYGAERRVVKVSAAKPSFEISKILFKRTS